MKYNLFIVEIPKEKRTLLCFLVYSLGISFRVGTMNNRQTNHRHTNHHFVQINAPDVYCLSRNWFGALLDTSVLTPLLDPPPCKRHPLNITTHYDKTTLIVLVVLLLLPARPFWIVAGFCCYIRLCIISGIISDSQEGVGKGASKLNR